MKTTLIVIRNEAEHRDAMLLVEELLRSDGDEDLARLTAQARLIEDYERKRWPRVAPSIPGLLTYLMDQHGLSRSDLIPLLGTASRVSEVLRGKRHLSMAMVKRLRERFHVSADLLIPATPPRKHVAA